MSPTTHAEATTYDPFDPAFQDDPYPAYRRLRDEDPVHRHEVPGAPPFLVVSRFADVWDVVRDPATFSSAQGLTFYPDEIERLGLAPTIVMMDPPRQTELRALIAKGFTPRRVLDLEPRIRRIVHARVADLGRARTEGRVPDLHRDLSQHVPTWVLAELLGVPESDRARFGPWVRALVQLQDDGFDVGRMQGAEAVAEMFGYFGDLVAQRRTDPRDDLVSALVHAEHDGTRLTDWDVLGFCFVMVAGGTDTTANLISSAVPLLDAHPDQRELLLDEPCTIGAAVPEMLRLESSVQGLARTATRDAEIAGVPVTEGEKVLLLYGSANRDEREFGPTAAELDVRRNAPRHLGFASGPHFCIGNHLARLMTRVTLEELLTAYPRISADTAAGERLHSAFTRGWVSLPVDLGV